jgi:hypothetical protein
LTLYKLDVTSPFAMGPTLLLRRTDIAELLTVDACLARRGWFTNDDAVTLARGLKAALDLTNSAKAKQ